MFKNKNQERIARMKETLDEFTEHMYLVSDGMVQFQKELVKCAKEINMIKSYTEMIVMALDKKGIISKEELEENVKLNLERKMKVITSDLNKYEKDMKEETKNMKHLIEKFKSSITNWFDDDGNPITNDDKIIIIK